MLKRYLIALAITVGIYYSPYIIPTNADWFWVRSSSLSTLYILLIYHFAKTRVMCFLISIEFIAMCTNLGAWYQYQMASESQLFNDHYGSIMSYCYIGEVLTIMGGVLSGRFKRIYHLWVHSYRSRESDRSAIFIGKSHLCKSQQKVF